MAMGIYGGSIGVAVAIGPLVGGAITDGLGWEWIFFINVPIGVAALAVTQLRLRESRDPEADRIDWGGLVTFALAVPARARAAARQRRGLGQHADRGPARGCGAADGRLRGHRAPHRAADAAARPVPPPRLHRRAAGGLRPVGLDVRDVPLPDPVHAGLPGAGRARGRRALPADHGRLLPRRADRGRAAEQGARALHARRRADAHRRRAAAHGGLSATRSGPRCCPASWWPASASGC